MFHQQALRTLSRTEADETFLNPIITGFNPDPSFIRVGSDYFLATSSFEFTPGAPIYHSKDLIQWTLIGHALTRKSQVDIKAPEPGGGIWACTLRHHDGYFYLTTCCWDRYRPQEASERAWPRGFYVKTKDIWNSDSWSDPIYFDQPGFDQDLFWDDDGKVYLATTHRKVDYDPEVKQKQQAIHVCSVDLETGNSTSPSTMIRESKVGSGVSEGSHFFKRGKYYYLFTAEGGTESGHSEYCFRSEKITGPWDPCPDNPLVQNSTNEEVQNTGHCDFLEDEEGRWWAVCLAVRPLKTETGWATSVFGRETFLMPVGWKDDWPVLNRGNPLALTSRARDMYVYDQPLKWSDNFQASQLQLGWYRKNTAVKPDLDHSLTARAGYLRLHGGPYKLSSPASPTAFFRKQKHREGLWRTRLDFMPATTGCEAGTVVYWNYLCWSSIGIRRTASGGRQIVVTPAQGNVDAVDLSEKASEVELVIHCHETKYRLGFREVPSPNSRRGATADTHFIGEISIDLMTAEPPIGMPFTGMMLGIYCFGDMQRCLAPADFAYAEFIG